MAKMQIDFSEMGGGGDLTFYKVHNADTRSTPLTIEEVGTYLIIGDVNARIDYTSSNFTLTGCTMSNLDYNKNANWVNTLFKFNLEVTQANATLSDTVTTTNKTYTVYKVS